MTKNATEEEYLDKNFDYTKLTKIQLRKIMYENGVDVIPPLHAKKAEILNAYKTNIFDRLDVLKKKGTITDENPFQKTSVKTRKVSPIEEITKNESPSIVIKNPKKTEIKETTKKDKRPTSSPVSKYKSKQMKEESLDEKDDKSYKFSIPLRQERRSSVGSKKNSNINTPIKNDSILNILSTSTDNESESPNLSEESKSIKSNESSLSSSFFGSFTDKSSNSPIKQPVKDMNKLKNGIEGHRSDPSLRKNLFVHTPTKKVISSAANISDIKEDNRIFKKRYLLISLVLSFVIYLKFFCPYCTKGSYFCIPVPKHSRIIDGDLVCDENYITKRGLFRTYCIKDNRREIQVQRELNRIKRKLEGRYGDFVYKLVPSHAIPVKELTEDAEILEKLKKLPNIVIRNGLAYSKKKRIRFKSFMKYYAIRALFVTVPLLIILVGIKIVRSISRKRQLRISSAKRISKDVCDALIRQIYISTKNPAHPQFVVVEQLQDCFGAEPKVWMEVEKIIARNSNIKKDFFNNTRTWEWVGPILYKPELNNVF